MEEENKINEKESKLAKIEAVLFLYGEPLSKEKISKITKIAEGEIDLLLEEMSSFLSEQKRGLMLIKKNDAFLLSTKPEFSDMVETFIKEDLKEDLTPASLETLSLIAYFGPISRAQIDFIRGVNSSFILRNLLIRGVVERKQGKGNAYLYETTFDFLKFLGIKSKEELPEFSKYQELKNSYFNDSQSSQPANL